MMNYSQCCLTGIVNCAAGGIITLDHELRIGLFNPAAERVFGCEAEEMLGQALDRLLPARFRTGHGGELRLFAQTGVTQRRMGGPGSLSGLRSNGEEFPMEASISQAGVDEQRYFTVILRDITGRTRTENQLRASIQESGELKAALDEPAIVATTDSQGKIVYVNDKFCAISKYSRSELLGQDHRIMNSGYHSKAFIKDLWATVSHGKVWCNELRNKASNGSLYWVDTTIVPFPDEGGKPRQYVAIRTDITGHKRIQEAFRANEERFRNYVEQAADPIFVHNSLGRFIDVKQQACATLGSTREELLGLGVFDIETAFDLSSAQSRVGANDPEQPRTLFADHRRKDGSTFPVEIRFGCFDLEGQRRSLGMARDITESKQAETALRESEKHCHAIADSTPQLAWIARPDGYIHWYNQRWYDYTGSSLGQIDGRDWQSLHDPRVLPSVMAQWADAITTKEAFEMEFPLRGADGRFRKFLNRAVPLKDSEGKVVQWFGTNTTLTS